MARMGFAFVAALAMVLGTLVRAYPEQPANPVVGILSSPLEECPPVPQHLRRQDGSSPYNACVFSYAVRLLEAQGVRAIVFPWNASYEQQLELASKVNGVWLPGGGLWGRVYTEYLHAIERLYSIARDMNARGDRFVLWGTCWGFEMLSIAAAGGNQSIMTYPIPGMEPLMMSVNFTTAQPASRMLGNATTPADVLDAMAHKKATLNWHKQALLVDSYEGNEELRGRFVALATTRDPSGKYNFVAAVEDRDGGAIYGTQFHPERPPFEFANDHIGHSPSDIAVSQFYAEFIASQLRLNNHTFSTPEEAESLRVAQWPLKDIGWGIRTYFVIDPPASG